MPLAEVRLIPGLDVEKTATYEKAAYDQIDYGRFKAGMFQKLGGWSKYYPNRIDGEGKALHAWQDLNGVKHLAVATTTEVDVITEGVLIQVTPQVLETNPTPDFSTVSGSNIVNIVDGGINNVTPDDSVEFLTPVSIGGIILSGIYRIATRVDADEYTILAREDATATEANAGTVPEFTTTLDSATISVGLDDHGQVAGNTVVFPVSTSVGGLTVFGKYVVTATAGADDFLISATTAATSGATVMMNGGDARLKYYIAIGPGGAGLGYGLGDYGEGPYGLGGGAGTDQMGLPLEAREWSLNNWGELLLATPAGGGVYFWGPDSGFVNMSLVVEGPLYNTGMFVSSALQQVITYGSSINAWETGGIGVYQDPLLIQWCDLSNFFEWTATAETQAGNFRIPTGSAIIGACATKNRNLFWTDLDLYVGLYTNQPFIYAHNQVGSNCGLIGQHAWGQFGDATYWMGKSNFFTYAGAGVLPIPCDVWDFVFQDLDDSADPDRPGHLISEKSVCGSNTDFTEVWFFFPSASGGLGYPDKYVKYNIVEGTWESGPMSRLAWLDRSVLGSPIAISGGGFIYAHESGADDDGAPLLSRFRSTYFYIEEGQDFVNIDEIIPDFIWGLYGGEQDAQISISLYTAETPGEDPVQNGPYLVTKASKYVSLDPPLRAKLAAVEVSSADTGSFWRLGLLRFRWSRAGRR